MNILIAGLFSVLKKLLLKTASENFLEWLFFWVADIIVKSTKTKKDDELMIKLKEAMKE